jgi:hypothetical protein
MQRHKFIALPNDDTFHLTPKLWMAVGLIAYNYHLLTLEPLQILATSRDARHVPPSRVEAAARGLAVMISTEGLAPATRTAISEIARTLLTPLGLQISTHGGWQITGRRRSTRYLLVQDAGPIEQFAIAECQAPQPETGEAIL